MPKWKVLVGVAGSAQWMGNMIAHIKYIWPRKPEAKKVTMPQKVNYYAEYYSYYRRCILITNRDISFTRLPNRTFHFDHAVCTLLARYKLSCIDYLISRHDTIFIRKFSTKFRFKQFFFFTPYIFFLILYQLFLNFFSIFTVSVLWRFLCEYHSI